MENLYQSHGASPAVCDHTVLPATRHRWTRPALIRLNLSQTGQAGTRFAYPEVMKGWVDLSVGWGSRSFKITGVGTTG